MKFEDFYKYHHDSKINAINEDDYCYHLNILKMCDEGKINKKNFKKFLQGN